MLGGAVRRVAVPLRLDGDDGTMLGEPGQEVRREGELDGHQAARDQHHRRAADQGSAVDLIVDAQTLGHDASAFEPLHRKSPVAAAGARGQERARADDESAAEIQAVVEEVLELSHGLIRPVFLRMRGKRPIRQADKRPRLGASCRFQERCSGDQARVPP
jgi:hypothetical protein